MSEASAHEDWRKQKYSLYSKVVYNNAIYTWFIKKLTLAKRVNTAKVTFLSTVWD